MFFLTSLRCVKHVSHNIYNWSGEGEILSLPFKDGNFQLDVITHLPTVKQSKAKDYIKGIPLCLNCIRLISIYVFFFFGFKKKWGTWKFYFFYKKCINFAIYLFLSVKYFKYLTLDKILNVWCLLQKHTQQLNTVKALHYRHPFKHFWGSSF